MTSVALISFSTKRVSRHAHAFEGLLVVFTVLVLPALLYLTHAAAYARVLYPATNLLLAAALFQRRSPWYVGHCILLFLFVSLARRLVDAQAGWDPSNPVLLAPYLVCLLSGVTFIRYWVSRFPERIGPFLVVLLCVAYGVILAVLAGRVLSSMVDALKWSVGPLLAVHVLAHRDQLTEYRKVAESCLFWGGAFLAVYGAFQYVAPPLWDTEWMRGVATLGMTSIGQPEPLQLRVFSTMNSPGSLGAIMLVGIVVALKRKPAIALPVISAMLLGLALCQYRTLWGATALAILLIVVTRPSGRVARNLVGLLIIGVLLASMAVMPEVKEALYGRAKTLTSLESDGSLAERRQQYVTFLREPENLVLGSGLAINGTSRRLDRQARVVFDSGLIEIWRALGVIVGTVFLGALATLTAALFRSAPGALHDLPYDRAIVVATLVQLPMGSTHVGEVGLCAWLFLGLALASQLQAPETRCSPNPR